MKNKRTVKKETAGTRLIRAMGQAVAHHRGEIQLRTTSYSIPDVKAIRQSLGLSQNEFATRFHFSSRTLQEWEQGRSKPDSSSSAYLTVIERNPAAVEKALTASN